MAITGGIGEGKSTVLDYVRELGYSAGSADDIARQVFSLDATQIRLASLLGVQPPVKPEFLRGRLADSEIRQAVNRITHPLILAMIRETPVEFLEVPLLIETCLQGEFDRVWVVTCGEREQLRRLIARFGDEEAAIKMIRTQLTSRAKTAFADSIIRTNQEECAVKRSVTVAAQRDLC